MFGTGSSRVFGMAFEAVSRPVNNSVIAALEFARNTVDKNRSFAAIKNAPGITLSSGQELDAVAHLHYKSRSKKFTLFVAHDDFKNNDDNSVIAYKIIFRRNPDIEQKTQHCFYVTGETTNGDFYRLAQQIDRSEDFETALNTCHEVARAVLGDKLLKIQLPIQKEERLVAARCNAKAEAIDAESVDIPRQP